MALNKNTLKAAVKKYAPYHAEGRTAEQVKAEIAKDDKQYDEAAINEIYDALSAEEKESAYTVVKEFRSITDFNLVHTVDEDVSHFEQSRLDQLVELGLVEKS